MNLQTIFFNFNIYSSTPSRHKILYNLKNVADLGKVKPKYLNFFFLWLDPRYLSHHWPNKHQSKTATPLVIQLYPKVQSLLDKNFKSKHNEIDNKQFDRHLSVWRVDLVHQMSKATRIGVIIWDILFYHLIMPVYWLFHYLFVNWQIIRNTRCKKIPRNTVI